MEHRNISLFRGYSDTESVETSLEEIVNIIKCDAALRDRTEKHRYYLQQDLRRDADREKSGCPCFAVAVCFEGGKTREHICAWTGYTLVDLDHIAPERMAATLTLICADKYTLMAYTTISGHGIRIICRIDDLNGAEKGKAFRQYAKYFNQVNDYYSCLVGFESDGQCKNATRISGLASDPHVYYNPSAAAFVLQNSPIAPQPQDSASEAVPTKRNKRLEKVVKAAERLLEEEGVSYCEHHHNEYVMRMGYLLNQYGVARKTAAAWAAEHFPDYDGDVAAVIGSCYANTGEHGTRSLVRRGEGDEKFATVADIEQFLSEQAKFRKNTVSGKFEVLMTDCGEEYAELTDRYVNTLWSRMNKAGMLARIADIIGVGHVIFTVVAAVDVIHIRGNVINGNIGGIQHRVGVQPGGGGGKIGVIVDGDALAEQLQPVQIDGEIAHLLLAECQQEQHRYQHDEPQKPQPQLVQPQQGGSQELAPAVGEIHTDDGIGVNIAPGFLHELFQRLDAHHVPLFLPPLFGLLRWRFGRGLRSFCFYHSLYRFLMLST